MNALLRFANAVADWIDDHLVGVHVVAALVVVVLLPAIAGALL